MGTSPFCPDCGGSGKVAKYNFALDCPLCKAHSQGNSHVTLRDVYNPMYLYYWTMGESNPLYWLWLKGMVTAGYIDPNYVPPEPQQKKKNGKSTKSRKNR